MRACASNAGHAALVGQAIAQDDDAMNTLRIGIVLPADGATQLRVAVPNEPYQLRPASCGGRTAADSEVSRYADGVTVRTAEVQFVAVGERVRAEVAGQPAAEAASWTLSPPAGRIIDAGEVRPDVPAVVIDEVVAGRGFHWQTRTRQCHPGVLTVRSAGGALFLTADLPMELYLAGVITAEMSGACPQEFLKAQCVVARSWTAAAAERKHADLGIDFCNDDCCQRYQGVSELNASACRAVRATAGRVLRDEAGAVVDANYSKSCGGIAEAPEAVWGSPKPGLCALVDAPSASGPARTGSVEGNPAGENPADGSTARFWPVTEANIDEFIAGEWLSRCDAWCSPRAVEEATIADYLGRVDRGGGFFRWTVSYDRARLEDLLRSKSPPDSPMRQLNELIDLAVTKRGVSGRATAMDVTIRDAGGDCRIVAVHDQYAIRDLLHERFLYSSAFRVRKERDANGRILRVHLHGAGWGHGVGFCQIGALGMALAGHDCDSILSHYFPRARLGAPSDACPRC